jgi:hypothetical protein
MVGSSFSFVATFDIYGSWTIVPASVKPEGGPKLRKQQTKNYAFLVLKRRVSTPPKHENSRHGKSEFLSED